MLFFQLRFIDGSWSLVQRALRPFCFGASGEPFNLFKMILKQKSADCERLMLGLAFSQRWRAQI